MGLLSTVVKIAATVVVADVARGMWEAYQIDQAVAELTKLEDAARNNTKRDGTVKANVTVQSRQVVEDALRKFTTRIGEQKLRERVEIFLESIPD